MIWEQFDNDKAYLEKQYKVDHWDKESGISVEELRENCQQIVSRENMDFVVRRVELIKEVLLKAQIEINPYDWFQDKINHGQILTCIEEIYLEEAYSKGSTEIRKKREISKQCSAYTGEHDFGHCIPDWKRIITYGFAGLKEQAEKKMMQCKEDKKRLFYWSCSTIADSACVLVKRLAKAAEEVGEAFPKQKLVAESLYHLSTSAPSNTLEALQMMLLWYELQTFVEGTLIRSFGNLDALLYDFYKRDLENGVFTQEQIRELLDYFIYKLRAKEVTANIPICIGAADENYAANELSYIFLEEYGRLGVYDPKIHIRYNSFTQEKLLREVMENIRKGHNSYVFLNDETISEALQKIGVSKEESRDYAIVGCYEPCVNGKEVPCSCNGRINLLKALEVTLNNGEDMGSGNLAGIRSGIPEKFHTFTELYEALKKQIAYFAEAAMELVTDVEKHYPQIHTAPFLSMSLESCMENGKDAYEGGAVYNNSSINAFGIANLTDALEVIKYLVYEEKKMTLTELVDILRDNWKNHENIRLKCKKYYPKYGNGNQEADELAAEIMSYTASLINGKANGRGGVFRFGAFSIDWRIYFGEKTWATPDGRMAGEPISKNIDAVAGQDKNGVTAAIQSAAIFDFSQIPNGTVLDITLHNTAVSGEEGMNAMLGLLNAYMKKGGVAIQFNVLDERLLIDAQKNPENYKNLQVRLCGWNVYYINLDRKEQNDFIKQLKESR